MCFVNRVRELDALNHWWRMPSPRPAIVWGRRRTGKTMLIQQFARTRRTVFHIGARRPLGGELAELSHQVAAALPDTLRNVAESPYTTWDDALSHLAELAHDEPLLLVLDEFPEIVFSTPELPAIIRAFLDRTRGRTELRLLICGSAVRSMWRMQEHREPLYGRFDLRLAVHPFRPHESAGMLTELSPADRALVYGIVDGIPLYLSWWDQQASVSANLGRLVCTPTAPLLVEGELILSTEGTENANAEVALRAIANGKTKFSEIHDALGTDPTRTLTRLTELRLIERLKPVTEPDDRRSRRTIYRIIDNFLKFHLSVTARYRTEIERGLGATIVESMVAGLDDHMGPVYEEAFRDHLRRMAVAGDLPPDIVAIGPWWHGGGQDEIDAVALRGRSRTPLLVGEAKWTRSVNGARLERGLARKAALLTDAPDDLIHAVCARDRVEGARDETLTCTAADIFAP